MVDLHLGIDVGTSGIRTAIIDGRRDVVGMARADHVAQDPTAIDAIGWWQAVEHGLKTQINALEDQGRDPLDIVSIAVDGTSGSMVLVDDHIRPVTPALMYDSKGFDAEATLIAEHAEEGAITKGSNSALARMLRLQSLDVDNRATHLCHQADFILAHLRGRAGISDDNNTLKLGFDPAAQRWPEWLEKAGVRTGLLPDVRRVGARVDVISPDMAKRFGLSPGTRLHAGTTDSIAAFLATPASKIGDAVTSLGTTLAIKLLSDVRIDDATRGLYSHRLGDRWLAGGASNTGGGVLMHYFTVQEIEKLSSRIDPSTSTELNYYPLIRPGERFPINDPDLPPKLVPRPEMSHLFLQAIFEGIARIEAACYAATADLGAPPLRRIFTAGGGGSNPVWTAIRKRLVSPHIEAARHSEAAIGAASLGIIADDQQL